MDDIPWEQRCDLLRANLRSTDPAKSLAAAKELGPWYLSLEEIRLQTAILVRHPYELVAPPGSRALGAGDGANSLGSPDLIPLLEALVHGDDGSLDAESLHDLHRVALPDHLPDLVRLLEPAEGELYGHLLWLVRLLADNTDSHREVVAGAFLYARAAHAAEIEGRPWPLLQDFRFPGDGPATSAAFLQKYAALLEGRDAEVYDGYAEEFPRAWLDRWRRQDAGGLPPQEPPATQDEAFSPAEARARVADLAAWPLAAWKEEGVRVDRLLPLIEVAAPDALDDLLGRWQATADDDTREQVSEWRARRSEPQEPTREAEAILAALERGEKAGSSLARIGLLGERARPQLEKYRRERHAGLYWTATAGLAIAGDAAARTEFLAFLREDRISVFDANWDTVCFTLNGDPDCVEHWVSRVGANCCLWFWADKALEDLYPTLPDGNTVRDTDDTVRRTRDWWTRWRNHLRSSRLANGWVPVAE